MITLYTPIEIEPEAMWKAIMLPLPLELLSRQRKIRTLACTAQWISSPSPTTRTRCQHDFVIVIV